MTPKLYVVKWRDAHYASEEVSVEDAKKRHKPAYYYSAGILVESDKDGVTLAMDYGLPLEELDGHSWRTRSFIPRELIVEEYSAGSVIRRKKPHRVVPPRAIPHVSASPSGDTPKP